jgi:hypothetical protein
MGEILLSNNETHAINFPYHRGHIECPVCLTVKQGCLKLPCGHGFCEPCISQWFQTRTTCPMCREDCG